MRINQNKINEYYYENKIYIIDNVFVDYKYPCPV